MKATGIVRRIDDLGRVVIPKEIRVRCVFGKEIHWKFLQTATEKLYLKNIPPLASFPLMRDSMRRCSPNTQACPAWCATRTMWWRAAGVSKKEYLERRVSPAVEDLMESRKAYTAKQGDTKALIAVEGLDRPAAVACPILSAGDIIGAVILLVGDAGAPPTEADVKLAQTAAAFLGKLMEE